MAEKKERKGATTTGINSLLAIQTVFLIHSDFKSLLLLYQSAKQVSD